MRGFSLNKWTPAPKFGPGKKLFLGEGAISQIRF